MPKSSTKISGLTALRQNPKVTPVCSVLLRRSHRGVVASDLRSCIPLMANYGPFPLEVSGQADPFESIYGLGLDPKTVSEVDDPYDHWGLYVIPCVGAAWGVGDQFRTVVDRI